MGTDLVLSLFPGIGLLDMAFEEAGFCVVRGPDTLWGGDIHGFSPPAGRFDGVIGGPPCQAFSRLRHIVEQNGYQTAPNLIPEFERVVAEARPDWFVMENVCDAPLPVVPGYAVSGTLLNNRWFGGEQNRVRRFTFGVRGDEPIDLRRYLPFEALEPVHWEPAVLASSGGSRRSPVALLAGGKPRRVRAGEASDQAKSRSFVECLRLQGLPDDFLSDAPFTAQGKRECVGNGVPLPMGRAIAQAVRASRMARIA